MAFLPSESSWEFRKLGCIQESHSSKACQCLYHNVTNTAIASRFGTLELRYLSDKHCSLVQQV